MKINLSKIKPSPKPIRTSWDEAKMDDLRWSLMEEGQVEPIGVHENSHGYVIVWGHRRVEAARRAGWGEIEAVVVPQDEIDNLIQAGIENLAGEDMSVDDKAEWAQRLVEMGLSQKEISRRSTVPVTTISKWLIYKSEKEAGVAMATPKRAGDDEYRKVVEISRSLGDDLSAKKAVAKKVSDEDLTTIQTRAVADAYRDAPTPAVKQKILETPIVSRDTAADILRRSVARVRLDEGIESQKEISAWKKEREDRRTFENYDFAVKEYIDATNLYLEKVRQGPSLVKFGKYSPEAARYVSRKIATLIDELKTYQDVLETVT